MYNVSRCRRTSGPKVPRNVAFQGNFREIMDVCKYKKVYVIYFLIMYCDMCIYNFIWYIDNDKYEFNSRTVGRFNNYNHKHVIYMKKPPKITQRQEIDKDVHKNICIVYKYKDFI